jgi:kynurenine formamidase
MTEATTGHVRDELLKAIEDGVRVYDLGRPLFYGVPRSANHPEFRHVVPRRHGDMVRPDGSSGANDLIITGSHVGTHIDALCHVSHRGRMYGGASVDDSFAGGRFVELGIETVAPVVRRGILLDVPAVLGVECCEPAYEVTVDDLEGALRLAQAEPREGDVLLIRTGWGRHFDDRAVFEGDDTGVPGPGVEAGTWIASHKPHCVGGETIAFEHFPTPDLSFELPVHRLLLVEHGIHIIELLDLELLAADQQYEFTFVLSPLKIVGATASPARPIALVGEPKAG